jgi:hypothetical protein
MSEFKKFARREFLPRRYIGKNEGRGGHPIGEWLSPSTFTSETDQRAPRPSIMIIG